MSTTQIANIVDVIGFSAYTQQLTEEKARMIQSGMVERSGLLDGFLSGPGVTFQVPSWADLDATTDVDRVSNDAPVPYDLADASAGAAGTNSSTTPDRPADPFLTSADEEIAVRLSRNASWSSMDLSAALAASDPMDSIAERVSYYWARRLQKTMVAAMTGIFAMNDAGAGDYTNDVSAAGSFTDGVTNFSAEAFLDAANTMGDSMEELTGVMVHSTVYNRMQKNNLIDFIPDSLGVVRIPTFLGREVIVDDGLPVATNVYDTWLFGRGAVQLGVSDPNVPTEIERQPGAGNGGGQEVLYNRVEWSIHPVGHAYIGASVKGGPANTVLDDAASWSLVYPERKQIKIARLQTTEHA